MVAKGSGVFFFLIVRQDFLLVTVCVVTVLILYVLLEPPNLRKLLRVTLTLLIFKLQQHRSQARYG